MVFLQSRSLGGEPNALTVWVNGDGAGHFLNAWIKDSGGQVWTMSFGQVKHAGWQQMTAYLSPSQPWPSGHISGPDNGQIDYPISFQGLTLDDGNDNFMGQGTLYLDDLASESGATAPIPTPAPPGGAGGGLAAVKPVGASASFRLEIGSEFSYAQPWGAPRTGDVCQALKYDDWDDTQDIYRGLTVELLLTNNSPTGLPDDWGGVEFVTGYDQTGRFCPHEYLGSGPPPGETRSVTYFGLIPMGDYVKYIRLNQLNGEVLEMCLNRDGYSCQ